MAAATMPDRAAAAIEIADLGHRYPGADRAALEGVGFTVAPGQRLGLLGPNGAGKSTLMRIVCGSLPVMAGRVRVAGHDVASEPLAVRTSVGYLPEHVPLYHELRVREHLAFRARIKRVPGRGLAAEIERVAARTGIREQLATPIGQLSRGFRQRVGIADALLGSPPLLVLDEPTVGLDPNQVLEIRAMLRELGGQQTLVFSSHVLAEVEMLCDRVVVLSHGRVVADETLAEALRPTDLRAAFRASEAEVRRILAAIHERTGVPTPIPSTLTERAPGEIDVRLEIPAPLRERVPALLTAIGEATRHAEATLLLLQPGQTRLEQRFAEVTGASRSS